MTSQAKYFYYFGGDDRIPKTERPHKSSLVSKNGKYTVFLYEKVKDQYPPWAVDFPENINTTKPSIYKQIINYCNGMPTIILNDQNRKEFEKHIEDPSKLTKVEYNSLNIAQIWINDSNQEDISRLVKAHLDLIKGSSASVEDEAKNYVKYIGTADTKLKNFFLSYDSLKGKVDALYKDPCPPSLFNTRIKPKIVNTSETKNSSEIFDVNILKAKLADAEAEINILRGELSKRSPEISVGTDNKEIIKSKGISTKNEEIDKKLKELKEKEDDLNDRESILEVKLTKFLSDKKEFARKEAEYKKSIKELKLKENELKTYEDKLSNISKELILKRENLENEIQIQMQNSKDIESLKSRIAELTKENNDLKNQNRNVKFSAILDDMITSISPTGLENSDRKVVEESIRQAQYYKDRLEKKQLEVKRLEERIKFLENEASPSLNKKTNKKEDDDKDSKIQTLEKKLESSRLKRKIEHSKLIAVLEVLSRIKKSELFVENMELQKKLNNAMKGASAPQLKPKYKDPNSGDVEFLA